MNPNTRIRDNFFRAKENILNTQQKYGLQQPVQIVGATKTQPFEIIQSAIACGITNIGENRVQEAAHKLEGLKKNVTKHMIGHLQTNKVNKAIRTFDRIDSVDSVKLAKTMDKSLQRLDKIMPVLIEINTSGEKHKKGFHPTDTEPILSCFEYANLKIEGLMTVGPITAEERKIRNSFKILRETLDLINQQIVNQHQKMTTLSMGMSGDYLLAIEEGSTMVRLGTSLFGPRINY